MLNLVLIAGVIITVLTAIPVVLQMRNHPKGLYVCFFAEMWERFSYYGMRGLLIYYLTKHFLFDDARAGGQYASYTTLAYLLPLIGGLVADRWIGTRRAIIFGGLLLVAGHLGMAIEPRPNQQTLTYQGHTYEFVTTGQGTKAELKLKVGNESYAYNGNAEGGLTIEGIKEGAALPPVLAKGSYEIGVKTIDWWGEGVLFTALSLIIMGVGFLKPNISALVGQLYRDRDPRRDSGFQLYYFGINMGSFWAAILCGLLGETVGWWAGFGLAGIGMLAGLLWFVIGKPLLEGKGEAPDPAALKEKIGGVITREWAVYGLGVLGVGLVYLLVQQNPIVFMALCVASAGMLGYVVYNMFTRFNMQENFRLGLALLLSFASIIFWTLFELAGSALSLFTDRNVNLDIIHEPILINLFGKDVLLASTQQLSVITGLPADYIWIDMGLTAAQTQTFNAGFILIFAPIFAALFTFLSQRKIDPDPVKKFSFGLVCAGLGFLVLVWTAPLANGQFQLPLFMLITTYLLHTWGELALSPVGLSQQTKLSPPLVVSTMMALWFTGTSWAQFLGGEVTKLAATETIGGKVVNPKAALDTSLGVFNNIGLLAIGCGLGLFVLSFFVAKWAHGANDYEE